MDEKEYHPHGGVREGESDQNSWKGDGKNCAHCAEEIICWVIDYGTHLRIDRSNRIDCEDKGKIISYHLDCYDREVFGEVTKVTEKEMKKWKDNYDS